MACWNEIMAKSVAAKRLMSDNRASGEAAFEALARDFPESGMVHFQRGVAYEVLGDTPRAFTSYSKAECLFDVMTWRSRATTGRVRCSERPTQPG